ncbi:MAG: aspartate aminotransferase family protein [Deltaproteobacteria bacterium]|nr:aspartate aminotransferase family protein [Deltaproteobacteria bacterium]
MPRGNQERENYLDLLERLKTYFPVPVSNPIMDGYFIHTISHFLDRVDDLKSAAPILGHSREEHYHAILEEAFPEDMSNVEEVTELLVNYCQGMPIWGHPNAQVNVVPPTTIPSITAFIAAAIYNPNIIWDAYSGHFTEAEIKAVAMLSDLIGYDSRRSGGLFTFGGTGTILYGVKLALEKLFDGKVMEEGLREDVKIVASDTSHYSRLNVAGWLGLGMKNLVTIPTTRDNEMNLIDLEDYLRQAFSQGEKVAAIIATLGTTDAFGIDDLNAIVRLRDHLAEEYNLSRPPHVHADAVIGWAWAVFRDYDFEANSLGFRARTLRSLQDSLKRLSNLALADSTGVDFHKTGYAPYISSAFLVRDRKDLTLLSREPEQMPYLYHFGYYHPGIYTLECSRAGTGALAAYANMRLLGKQGYRILIGHVVEMAEMLRERLENYPFIQVLNDFNYGPVTLFRVYPDDVNAAQALQRELSDPAYRDQVEKHNDYNFRIFQTIHERAMRGEGVWLSRTDAYRHADYDGVPGPPIAALKSFILSPWTDLAAVDTVARQVLEAREQVDGLK